MAALRIGAADGTTSANRSATKEARVSAELQPLAATAVERTPVEGDCGTCGAPELLSYPVLSEGGWWMLVRCVSLRLSLSSMRMSPWCPWRWCMPCHLPCCAEPDDAGAAGGLVGAPVAAKATEEQPRATARAIERGKDRFIEWVLTGGEEWKRRYLPVG